MNKLQIIILTASVILAVLALLIFSGFLPGFRNEAPGEAGQIIFWGALPKTSLTPVLNDFSQRFRNIRVEYREIPAQNYADTLVSALASGTGPDVFILPQDQILKQKDLLYPLDSKTYPPRVFRDSFADIGELYARPEGIAGLPLAIDPMVLYWNRDLFRNAGIAQPPSTWDEFLDTAKKLTIKNGARITQSGAAMGEFSNVKNAKDILSLLILQTGNKIVDPQTLKTVFANKSASETLSAAESALLFFISFSDPIKENYSWNRTIPDSLEAFGAGRLAMYIGYASDLDKILALNPHLNFDIREVPQISGGSLSATYGQSLALAVSRQSANKATALTFIYDMTGLQSQNLLGQNSFSAPALRVALNQAQENPVLAVFYKSAVKSLGWLDPSPSETLAIWKEMSESVLSGAKRINQAVSDAQRKFEAIIPQDK